MFSFFCSTKNRRCIYTLSFWILTYAINAYYNLKSCLFKGIVKSESLSYIYCWFYPSIKPEYVNIGNNISYHAYKYRIYACMHMYDLKPYIPVHSKLIISMIK